MTTWIFHKTSSALKLRFLMLYPLRISLLFADNGIFSWTPTDTYKNSTRSAFLKFIATDSQGMARLFSPVIYMCACDSGACIRNFPQDANPTTSKTMSLSHTWKCSSLLDLFCDKIAVTTIRNVSLQNCKSKRASKNYTCEWAFINCWTVRVM